jgi:hypothetical protein
MATDPIAPAYGPAQVSLWLRNVRAAATLLAGVPPDLYAYVPAEINTICRASSAFTEVMRGIDPYYGIPGHKWPRLGGRSDVC